MKRNNDPGAQKYQSTFGSFVQRRAAAAKSAADPPDTAEHIAAENPEPVKPKPKAKKKPA